MKGLFVVSMCCVMASKYIAMLHLCVRYIFQCAALFSFTFWRHSEVGQQDPSFQLIPVNSRHRQVPNIYYGRSEDSKKRLH